MRRPPQPSVRRGAVGASLLVLWTVDAAAGTPQAMS